MRDPDSLMRMMKWSPISGAKLLNDFQIAANDPMGSNLDGLNCDQIHEVAMKKAFYLTNQEMTKITTALEEIKRTGTGTAELQVQNSNASENTILNSAYRPSSVIIMTTQQMESRLKELQVNHDVIEEELSLNLWKRIWLTLTNQPRIVNHVS